MSGNLPFGFGLPGEGPGEGSGGAGFDMGQLGAMLQQLGAMLQSGATAGGGPVNWTMAQQVARQAIEGGGGDREVTEAERRSVADAVDIAETWLDAACAFPRSATRARALNRGEWLEATLPAWEQIVTPIAEHVQAVTQASSPAPGGELPPQLAELFPGGLPPEASAMLGPLLGMAQQLGSTMFGLQVGQALGALAIDVLGVADIGVPLTRDHIPSLVPRNIESFAEGLAIPTDEVVLFLALRESAHQRLFAHVPWLTARMSEAIDAYARGIQLDVDRLRDAMGSVDPAALADPARLQEALGEDMFAPQDTPEQQAALARLETLLALVEGWVGDVVDEAVGDRLPSAERLGESMRRRRAAGGPAERTMASLVGLELRPRALREATRLWALLRESEGIEGRDARWEHPDLLPGHADLDDPEAFIEAARSGPLDAFDVDADDDVRTDDGDPPTGP